MGPQFYGTESVITLFYGTELTLSSLVWLALLISEEQGLA